MIWWMIKLIFRPVRLILIITVVWVTISILQNDKSSTQGAEELAWCTEYKPDLSYEECSNEFGY